MKQILYFLIGFLLAAIPLKICFAYDQTCYESAYNNSSYGAALAGDFVDIKTTRAEAHDLARISCAPYSAAGNPVYVYSSCDGNTNYQESGIAVQVCYNPEDPNERNAVWVAFNSQYDPEADSDGDGIPDAFDFYDDSDPYLVYRDKFWTDDEGNIIAERWQTDRGDTYYTGDISDLINLNENIDLLQTWQTPTVDLSDTDFSTPTQDPGIADVDHNTIELGPIGPSNPLPGQDIYMREPGQDPDPADDDRGLSEKIARNTSKTADNTARLGDHLSDITSAINRSDRNNVTGLNAVKKSIDAIKPGTGEVSVTVEGGATAEEIREAFGDADSEKSSFESVSAESHYSGITGDLVEGQDYQVPGELGDESFITEFFSSNPLIIAFQNSGFVTSDALPTAILDLGYLGVHQIDLSPLESGLQLAGNMLFALCSIGSLIMVVRG